MGASLASNYMDESLATFFHMWITVKIVDWLLFAVFEERRTEQICCHAAFKTTSLKLATSSRTYTFNSGQVLSFLINLIFSQIGFCNMMSTNSSNFWYEMWSSVFHMISISNLDELIACQQATCCCWYQNLQHRNNPISFIHQSRTWTTCITTQSMSMMMSTSRYQWPNAQFD